MSKTASVSNNFPKLHNAMWPGLVGKGGPGAEPAFDLDTMLDLTAKAEVNGVKFDGVDLFLGSPHTDINTSDDGLNTTMPAMNTDVTYLWSHYDIPIVVSFTDTPTISPSVKIELTSGLPNSVLDANSASRCSGWTFMVSEL